MQNIRLLGKHNIDEVIDFLIRSREKIDDIYGLVVYKGDDGDIDFFGHFNPPNINFAIDSLKHALFSEVLDDEIHLEVKE
jgi:hypothetical protein